MPSGSNAHDDQQQKKVLLSFDAFEDLRMSRLLFLFRRARSDESPIYSLDKGTARVFSCHDEAFLKEPDWSPVISFGRR